MKSSQVPNFRLHDITAQIKMIYKKYLEYAENKLCVK